MIIITIRGHQVFNWRVIRSVLRNEKWLILASAGAVVLIMGLLG